MENNTKKSVLIENSKNTEHAQRPKRKKESTSNSGHCNFFVLRKKRFCKMTVKEGEEYCGEHKKIDSDIEPNTDISKNSPVRIICPLDGKHTCYAHNLKKHLKICNARPKPTDPYISKGVNYADSEEDNSYKLLSTFPEDDILKTISKVDTVYNKYIEKHISEHYSNHKLLEDEMLKPGYGFKTKKHLKQVSSILGLITEYEMMKRATCYIEFGAGKGQLSFWLAKACEDNKESKVLLIERASPKHKKDNKIARNSDKVCRIRADISDIILDKVNIVGECSNIIGITKHLCGEATDLAIRSLMNIKENSSKVRGCILTFCCHHRCRWLPYTGKDFFKENNLNKNDFDIMCGMASWATCGSGLSREVRKEISEKDLRLNQRDLSMGLTRSEKEEIGRKSKNVLNWGRVDYLSKFNFKCNLHYYVETGITLENVCIVAVR
ncbi:tRNA:m(4)X modification enzyme TRM13 homolog [Diorhabda sublineata]|uniref:tRNA:m(4)X modification enzyme TRM13 homolog n=1 Tax=Diorhabda sublineata TaxID=1163346 RepID=UPI0024E12D1C|nr:tRNA:m(4)X modification enzyme TRM13 homolog [Diorhabda sublineata]